MGRVIPPHEERRLVGRFYASGLIGEGLHLALPFQVLVVVRYLGAPQLALLLLVERAVEFALELPVSGLADRFGRKRLVLVSQVAFAAGWFLIPVATLAHGAARFVLMMLAFGAQAGSAAGVETFLVSWVVDNLRASDADGLRLTFFGRKRSLALTGGLVASVAALALVAFVDVRIFFIASGVGELLAAALLLRIPEHIANGQREVQRTTWSIARAGLDTIRRSAELRRYVVSVAWSTLLMVEWAEVAQAALANAHFVTSGFAALSIGADIVGIVGALIAIAMAGWLGSRTLLMLSILAPGLMCLPLFASHAVALLIVIYIAVLFTRELTYTSGNDYVQGLMPSRTRATTSSVINLVRIACSAGCAALVALLFSLTSTATTTAILAVASTPAALFLLADPKGRRWTRVRLATSSRER
jgi:MFS family permease